MRDLHRSIEVSFKEPQGMEICSTDGARLLLQKNLEAGLPSGKRVAMLEGHFMIKA